MLIVGVSPWATIKTDHGINCKEIADVSDINLGRGGNGDKVPRRCYHVGDISVKSKLKTFLTTFLITK